MNQKKKLNNKELLSLKVAMDSYRRGVAMLNTRLRIEELVAEENEKMRKFRVEKEVAQKNLSLILRRLRRRRLIWRKIK